MDSFCHYFCLVLSGKVYGPVILIDYGMSMVQQKNWPWEAFSHSIRRRLLMGLLRDYVMGFEDMKYIKVELKHSHIPKLEEMEYIVWDKEKDVIKRGENWDEIEPLLLLIDRHKDELPDGWL